MRHDGVAAMAIVSPPQGDQPPGTMDENRGAGDMALRQVLVGHYDELKRRLARTLGSEDLAGNALHDAYLCLDQSRPQGIVDNPRQYLLTMAANIARMALRRERWWTSLEEMDAAAGVDETPDPLRRLEARRELAALQRVIDALTPRRRRILFASRIEGVLLRDLAAEFGLSQRMVEKELKAALRLCGAELGRDVVQRFGPRPRRTVADGAGEARHG